MKENKYLSFGDIEKIASAKKQFILKCKCGHSITMINAERTICSHCGKWCYRTPQIEFRYKMKEKLIKENK